MDQVTIPEYMAAIPECCPLQTYKEHAAMNYCMGIIYAIENNTCIHCDTCVRKMMMEK